MTTIILYLSDPTTCSLFHMDKQHLLWKSLFQPNIKFMTTWPIREWRDTRTAKISCCDLMFFYDFYDYFTWFIWINKVDETLFIYILLHIFQGPLGSQMNVGRTICWVLCRRVYFIRGFAPFFLQVWISLINNVSQNPISCHSTLTNYHKYSWTFSKYTSFCTSPQYDLLWQFAFHNSVFFWISLIKIIRLIYKNCKPLIISGHFLNEYTYHL